MFLNVSKNELVNTNLIPKIGIIHNQEKTKFYIGYNTIFNEKMIPLNSDPFFTIESAQEELEILANELSMPFPLPEQDLNKIIIPELGIKQCNQ